MTKTTTRRIDFVGVTVEGVTETHLRHPTGEYATLCGLDGTDFVLSQFHTAAGEKVDCRECRQIFNVCRQYRVTDFAIETSGA